VSVFWCLSPVSIHTHTHTTPSAPQYIHSNTRRTHRPTTHMPLTHHITRMPQYICHNMPHTTYNTCTPRHTVAHTRAPPPHRSIPNTYMYPSSVHTYTICTLNQLLPWPPRESTVVLRPCLAHSRLQAQPHFHLWSEKFSFETVTTLSPG
jgi:hypothetical protein